MELKNMELKLSFLLLVLCSLLLQESAVAGVGLSSFSIASLLPSINEQTPDLRPYGGTQMFNDHTLSPMSTDTTTRHKKHGTFAPAPHLRAFHAQSPLHHPSTRGHKHHHFASKNHHNAPGPYHQWPRAPYSKKGPAIANSPSDGWISGRHLPLPAIPSHHLNGPGPSPTISPTTTPVENNKKILPPLPSIALPPPPPNQGCVSVKCTEPLTYTHPGVPCGCVMPIQVRLLFSISLYTFFPLVSELAKAVASAIPLDHSQVRIMGADAADQQLERTTVLINLVPLADKFDPATAFSIYMKFWRREVPIKTSVFGVYEVLYVQYPGLPSSPPTRPSGSATVDIPPYPSSSSDDGPIKPLGVDVPRRRKNDSSKNMVIIIALSAVTAFAVCMGLILLLLSKCGCCSCLYRQTPGGLKSSDGKLSGGSRLLPLKSRPSSTSMSFSSSFMAYTGTAKVFSVDDIERATDRFSSSRILGEGGFGLVYGGILDDGRNVAVKVLKRDDQQGGREFLAEVEMLSRLHHRNLVKLIGICAEDQSRCLVYELVPNGSVESHLHGADKEVAPLDWCARIKIALGAARGLAYLHEDSSPRVIHRDFKSSNILLEHDYTPKVSDFGLARTAMEEGSKHISTHVMGTFGYLAPEYAMTGHLLVKSDVYSYGVVLLELLTGRKPVDFSQPPGQENLVAWARPLLATNEGLETIMDPTLKPNVPLDSFSKVAAIASMCVQPEVSHRPFMGEVVQALKLVCNEFEETREPVSRSFSQEDFYVDIENKHTRIENELIEDLEKCDSSFDAKIALSAVDLRTTSAGFDGQESESFRRQFNSVPLKAERKRRFWQRLRGLSRGSMSEHEFSSKL